jgi:hypothetical protein
MVPKEKDIPMHFLWVFRKKRSRVKPINKIKRRQWYDVTIAITSLLLLFMVFQAL